MKSIPFFSDEITITPHTATHVQHLNRSVSIREFSRGRPVRLLDPGGNEWLVECCGEFIQGPEVRYYH